MADSDLQRKWFATKSRNSCSLTCFIFRNFSVTFLQTIAGIINELSLKLSQFFTTTINSLVTVGNDR